MSDPIHQKLSDPALRGQIGTILHIGAGHCAELPTYLGTGAGQIHLVEPAPEALAVLEPQAAQSPRITLHPCAVGDAAGTAPLHLYNLADLSSLRPATGLADLFPGLRLIGTPDVATRPLEAILEALPGAGPGQDVLAIDAPGEEASIVQALLTTDAARRFSWVFVTVGVRPLYRDGGTVDQVTALLVAAGYVVSATGGDDPDRPCLAFQLDRRTLELEAAHRDLAARDASLTTTAKERDDLKAALEQARAQTEAAKATQTTTAKERDDLKAALEQARAQTEAKAEQLELARAALETQTRDSTATAGQMSEKIATLEAQLAARIAERNTLASEKEAVAKDRDAQASRAKDSEAASIRQEQNLTRALRLHEVAQADLRDLQGRFAELNRQKQQQTDLLRKLTARLQEAAQYLHGLPQTLPTVAGVPQIKAPEPAPPPRKKRKAGKA